MRIAGGGTRAWLGPGLSAKALPPHPRFGELGVYMHFIKHKHILTSRKSHIYTLAYLN